MAAPVFELHILNKSPFGNVELNIFCRTPLGPRFRGTTVLWIRGVRHFRNSQQHQYGCGHLPPNFCVSSSAVCATIGPNWRMRSSERRDEGPASEIAPSGSACSSNMLAATQRVD